MTELSAERLTELRHNATAYGLPRESMVELFAHIDALKVDRDRWERNHEALQDKFDCDKTCGCAYDSADDLCGYHSPRVIAAEARALAAETEVVRLRNLAIDIARAAVPQWKKEFTRAIAAEEKLASMGRKPDEDTKVTS